MGQQYVLEICAETMQSVVAADRGGADCIELCSALAFDGLTPSDGLLHSTLQETSLPIHVLIRPRAGNFVYDAYELKVMRKDILRAKALGASGVVIGLLTAKDAVDMFATQELIALARPMIVTFHRAFDACADLLQALEDVVAAGAHRILTSGGTGNVVTGAGMLRKLVEHADGRIEIVAGGGVRAANIRDLANSTAVTQFHSSVRTETGSKHLVTTIKEESVSDLVNALSGSP